MLKKILLGFALTITSLIVLVVGAVALIWMKPELVLTETRKQKLFDQYAASYFTQKPEKLGLQILPHGFFGKRIQIDLSSFCLKEPEACFDKVQVEFAFRFIALTKIRIDEVGPIEILNQFITLSETQKVKEPETEPSSFNLMDHLEIPGDLKVQRIVVESPKITIPGKDPITGSASVRGETSDQLTIEAQAKSESGLKANASILTGFTVGGKNPFEAKIQAKDLWQVDGSLKGWVMWTQMSFDVQGGLTIKKLIPWVETLAVKNLSIQRDQSLKLNADLETRIEPKFDWEARESALPKVKFNTDLSGKLSVIEKEGSYQYKVQIGPLSQKGIDLTAIAEGRLPFPKGQEYRFGLERALIKFDIPQFQTLVKHLYATSAAIPAPFSALRGSVHLQAGKENANIDQDTIPLQFVTDLNSSEQTVKTQSDGTLVFDPKTKRIRVHGESKVELVRVTLPDLDLLTPQPALAADSRLISQRKFDLEVKKKEVEKNEPEPDPSQAKFDFNWKVSTAPSGIQVNYPVFHPFAPAQITWNASTTENYGQIDLLPFGIEYMNRKAKLDYLHYTLKRGEKIFHYDGKLTIPKTDYTLYIAIIDQEGKPKVDFTSDPPLPQEDIISLLLFNQTTSELTPDESSSVASTQAAVTNRALGLFSIWALSSTPIEAVNFNPSTRVYSARVRLASGLTATIGTNWENTQEVALRKRLGRNWVLSTMVQTDSQTNTETQKTLLEWFRRF